VLNSFRNGTINRAAVGLAVILCLAAGATTPAGAVNRVRVNIANNSSYDIYQLFMSPTGDNNWGHDLLGDGTLTTGYSEVVTANPGRYDLKLVDEDGDTCIVMGLNVYESASWSITDRWLLSCEFHQTT